MSLPELSDRMSLSSTNPSSTNTTAATARASASVPDAAGRFGDFGGRFVPETLTRALDQLSEEYDKARKDPEFQRELSGLLKTFVGRPSPLYHAKRLSESIGGAQIWLKREDLNHTGTQNQQHHWPSVADIANGKDSGHR